MTENYRISEYGIYIGENVAIKLLTVGWPLKE
jgi:hypothetical protein